MKRTPPSSATPDPVRTGPRLRRTTLRRLSQLELGRVAAGMRDHPGTTGIENDCNTTHWTTWGDG